MPIVEGVYVTFQTDATLVCLESPNTLVVLRAPVETPDSIKTFLVEAKRNFTYQSPKKVFVSTALKRDYLVTPIKED